MGFISNDEIKDKCIGHYGILFKATPVTEGTLTKGSVIFVKEAISDEHYGSTYSIIEFETGKELEIYKTIFEDNAIMSDFLDENINNITKEGVLYYAKKAQINKNATVIQLRFNGYLSLWDKMWIKIDEKILRKKTLKKYSIHK